MATSSSFAQIWAGVQVEYDKNEHTAGNHQEAPIVQRSSSNKNYPQRYKWQIVWRNVIAFIILHVATVYGFYIGLCGHVYLKTLLFSKYCFIGLTLIINCY